jgi:hypothetical protein
VHSEVRTLRLDHRSADPRGELQHPRKDLLDSPGASRPDRVVPSLLALQPVQPEQADTLRVADLLLELRDPAAGHHGDHAETIGEVGENLGRPGKRDRLGRRRRDLRQGSVEIEEHARTAGTSDELVERLVTHGLSLDRC